MNIFINDRSDLDAIVAFTRTISGPATKITRLEDLKQPDACPRKDIVLMNSLRTGGQYWIEVTETGFAGHLFILDFLTDDQYAAIQQIARTMRANAVNYPEARKLLAND